MDGNDALDKALRHLAAKLPREALDDGIGELDGSDQELILNWLN